MCLLSIGVNFSQHQKQVLFFARQPFYCSRATCFIPRTPHCCGTLEVSFFGQPNHWIVIRWYPTFRKSAAELSGRFDQPCQPICSGMFAVLAQQFLVVLFLSESGKRRCHQWLLLLRYVYIIAKEQLLVNRSKSSTSVLHVGLRHNICSPVQCIVYFFIVNANGYNPVLDISNTAVDLRSNESPEVKHDSDSWWLITIIIP